LEIQWGIEQRERNSFHQQEEKSPLPLLAEGKEEIIPLTSVNPRRKGSERRKNEEKPGKNSGEGILKERVPSKKGAHFLRGKRGGKRHRRRERVQEGRSYPGDLFTEVKRKENIRPGEKENEIVQHGQNVQAGRKRGSFLNLERRSLATKKRNGIELIQEKNGE